jgi:TRAP-type uncharacterized transport system substrate-binding protein
VKRAAVLLLAATLVGVTAGAALAQRELTWSGGTAGGGWHVISNGMAALLQDEAGLSVRVLPGGGAQNPVLVDKGDRDIGLGLPPLLTAAARGEDPYRLKRMDGLRALAGNMSPTVLHVYVAADSRFATLTLDAIFRDRTPIRLAIPRPGTSDVWVLDKVMEFYGLCSPGRRGDCYRAWEGAGARLVRSTYAEQAEAFQRRRVDGAVAVLALPGAAVTAASQGRPLKVLALPADLVDHLATFGLGRATIPAGTYPKAANGAEDVTSASMGTTIFVSAAMAGDLAYTITRTINDHADRIRSLHTSLADFEPSRAWLHLGLALHPGAERYYREKGWLP